MASALLSDSSVRAASLAIAAVVTASAVFGPGAAASGLTLHTVHPPAMAIGMYLVAEACIAMARKQRRSNSKAGPKKSAAPAPSAVVREQQIDTHAALAFAAAASAFLGFGIEFYYKNTQSRAHFSTWHGLLGLAALGWLGTQAVFGTFMRQAGPMLLPARTRASAWAAHRLSGAALVGFFYGVAWLHTATFSFGLIGGNWMGKNELVIGAGFLCQVALAVAAVGIVTRVLRLSA